MAGLFKRIRQWAEGVSRDEEWYQCDQLTVGEIVKYFDRIDDHSQVRTALLARYGTGIKKTTDASGANTIETYTHEEVALALDAGMWEAVTIGWGHKIINALGTLFSNQGSRFELKKELDDEDLSGIEEILTENREHGGAKAALVACDKRAVQCGSAFALLEWRNGHVQYTAYDPGRLQACFGSTIEENGHTRPVDMFDLEDASRIIIRTGNLANGAKSYLGIYGRQTDWPLGRYVVFQNNGDGREIPAVGAVNTYDFMINGQPANPLSVWADEHPDEDLPEYPVCILKSGLMGGDELLPVSKSLHLQSLEYDIGASHTKSTSQRAATGTTVLTRASEARTLPLPRSLHGNIDLPPGMSLTNLVHNSTASVDAYKVLREEMVDDAAAHSVPDYMVVSEDHSLDASSGVALAVKTRPLRMILQDRASINQPFVRKLFHVEVALICMFSDESNADKARLSKTCQTWHPGTVAIPEDKKAKAERIALLKREGVYDTISEIRDWYDYDTIDQAVAEYERMKARKKKYPPLNEDPVQAPGKPTIGLMRKSGAPQQGQFGQGGKQDSVAAINVKRRS